VPTELIKAELIRIFKKWGKPKAIRVDNGEPFGSSEPSTTTPLALWLIGYGIHVIWNKPACPQQNGKVERAQSTSRRWSEIMKCADFETAQKQLNEAARLQRDCFQVSRLKNLTRKQAFEGLYTPIRIWDDEAFEPMKVYQFLKNKKYIRKVSSNGQITHFGYQPTVGDAFKGQYVSLKLEIVGQENGEIHLSWIVSDVSEKKIRDVNANYLNKQNLLNLSVMSKN
jgi:hypothetical protein